MSETPEERRERLVRKVMVAAVRAWRVSPTTYDIYASDEVLDALLAALEPPVADMVRLGVVARILPPEDTYDPAYWYRPRSGP